MKRMDTDMNIEITLIPKIDYRAATTCPKCKIWPNWIDASGICSHCKVSDRRSRVKGLWETLAAFLKGLVVKDRKSGKCDALPPSVVSD